MIANIIFIFSPKGDKEVEAEERLGNILGLKCRSVEDTMRDMARTLFEMENEKSKTV